MPLFPQLYSGDNRSTYLIELLAGLPGLTPCKAIRVEGVWLTEYLTAASYSDEEHWRYLSRLEFGHPET